jgi:hypothetical protein
MGLLELKTDLKSLKYGKDRIGGGDSGQPYIQTDINTVDQGLNRLRLTRFDDGLVRGGVVGATNASIVDTLRIGKFLTDVPQGPLFIVKQVGLQFSNPKLETRRINIGGSAGSGLLGFVNNVANTLNTTFGPTRIYNLGINTLAQIPVNAFGKHLNRHGLTPVQDDNTKYLAVARFNNENNGNRLVLLKDKLLNRPYDDVLQSRAFTTFNNLLSTAGSIFGFTNPLKSLTERQLSIDDYLGGPGSVYGIGRTLIRRYDYTDTKKNLIPFQKDRGVVDYAQTLGLSDLYFSGQNVVVPLFGGFLPPLRLNIDKITDINGANNIDLANPTKKPTQIDQNVINYTPGSTVVQKYTKLRETVDKLSQKEEIIRSNVSNDRVFTRILPLHTPEETNIDKSSPDFRYYGTPKINSDFSQAEYTNTNQFSRLDADILTVAFRIIDPFTLNGDRILLSAYMNGFKDSFNATWNETNYVGRAESFYVYNKFKRSVSFNLQIPCFNREQLFEKHRGLGQLAATTAGSYDNNFLGGVLIKLNVGNYIVGEYGILNSLDYSIPNDASWDILPDGRLSMLLDASFNFTIVHKDLPEYKQGEGMFKYLTNPKTAFLPSITNPDSFVADNYPTSSAAIGREIINIRSTPVGITQNSPLNTTPQSGPLAAKQPPEPRINTRNIQPGQFNTRINFPTTQPRNIFGR